MRKLKGAVSLVLVWGASAAVQSAVRAEGEADIANAESDPAVVMQRYIVSATRIGKNPWRYGSFPGFEVLSRASEEDTYWLLSSYFYERMIEKALLPADWFPQPPVPYTIIIDDTNLGAAPGGQIHLHPLNFHSPEDALTWGKGSLWGDVSPYVSDDAVASGDGDTTAINSNLYGVDTHGQMFSNLGVNRISYCTPPLPNWLIAGLTGRNAGIFREAYIAAATADKPGIWTPGFANFHEVKGPGTLWKSVDETRQLLQRIKKDKKTKIALRPLGDLFAETLPSDESDPIWGSEAALLSGGDCSAVRATRTRPCRALFWNSLAACGWNRSPNRCLPNVSALAMRQWKKDWKVFSRRSSRSRRPLPWIRRSIFRDRN